MPHYKRRFALNNKKITKNIFKQNLKNSFIYSPTLYCSNWFLQTNLTSLIQDKILLSLSFEFSSASTSIYIFHLNDPRLSPTVSFGIKSSLSIWEPIINVKFIVLNDVLLLFCDRCFRSNRQNQFYTKMISKKVKINFYL